MDTAPVVRFAVFLTALLLLAWAERRQPAWPVPSGRARVRLINFALGLAGMLSTRLLVALAGAHWLQSWQSHHPGLLSHLGAPKGSLIGGVSVWIIGLLCLDAALYLQHRIFHLVPWLWRWHGVHHSDAHLDVTSALRFHPLEIAISWFWKLLVSAVLGIPAPCVLVFEASLSSLALFNHANLRIAQRGERWLAGWLITPAAHRRHHRDDVVSDAPNYGFSVPWWDMLGRTWQPALPVATQPERVGMRTWISGASANLGMLLHGNLK